MNKGIGEGSKRRGMGWFIGSIMLFVVVALVLIGVTGAYFHPTMMGYYGGGYHFPFFFPFGFVFFFLIAFFVLRMLLWPWGWGGRREHWHFHSDAEEILRQRYARGEITKEQFEQMARDLEQHR